MLPGVSPWPPDAVTVAGTGPGGGRACRFTWGQDKRRKRSWDLGKTISRLLVHRVRLVAGRVGCVARAVWHRVSTCLFLPRVRPGGFWISLSAESSVTATATRSGHRLHVCAQLPPRGFTPSEGPVEGEVTCFQRARLPVRVHDLSGSRPLVTREGGPHCCILGSLPGTSAVFCGPVAVGGRCSLIRDGWLSPVGRKGRPRPALLTGFVLERGVGFLR